MMAVKTWVVIILSILTLSVFSQNDTINKVDENNLKQAYWIYYYSGDAIKEEGRYTDNKKEGIWKAFYASGTPKSEITYVKNRPNGYAKFYFENGKVSEEGIWKINKWIGEYKMYHKNGNLSYDWEYSENGKRTGEQKYFHSNGKIMIEGDWSNGKEQGVIKQYDEKGDLVSERTFEDGKQDPNSIKYYTNKPVNKTEPAVTPVVKVQKKTNEKIGYFDGNGQHTLYNKNKQKTKEGMFVKGKLKDGKAYSYDANGKLTKTVIYKNYKITNIKYEE